MNEEQKSSKLNPIGTFLEKIKGIIGSETKDAPESFNVFSLCRVGHKEIIHSAILATLLDPCGGHRLGRMPLKNFLKQIKFKYNILNNVSVKTEETILSGQRRLDILIESDDFCIIVENKTTTVDHEGQLDTYAKWLNEKGVKNKGLFYLTYKGDSATKVNANTEYIRISYKEDIKQWLKSCIDDINDTKLKNISDTKLKNIFEQYGEFLKILTSEENMEINEALVKAIIENFDAANNIAKNIDKAKAYWLWNNILKKLMDKYNFKTDRDLNGMYKTNDIYFWYEQGNIKVQYSFENYGFKNPRREIIVKDKNGEEIEVNKKEIPFLWDDNFFKDNPENKAEKCISAIVDDANKWIKEKSSISDNTRKKPLTNFNTNF